MRRFVYLAEPVGPQYAADLRLDCYMVQVVVQVAGRLRALVIEQIALGFGTPASV